MNDPSKQALAYTILPMARFDLKWIEAGLKSIKRLCPNLFERFAIST
jgi:hypothetical protein